MKPQGAGHSPFVAKATADGTAGCVAKTNVTERPPAQKELASQVLWLLTYRYP